MNTPLQDLRRAARLAVANASPKEHSNTLMVIPASYIKKLEAAIRSSDSPRNDRELVRRTVLPRD